MNEQIRNEMILLLNIDGIKSDEQIKILSYVSSFLSSTEYFVEIKSVLNSIFAQPDFDIVTELSRLILNILTINKKCSFRKEIKANRMKYVIYAVIYNYMLKEQIDYLNKINIGTLRLMYCNCFDLLTIDFSSISIVKECGLLCGLFGNNKINI